jgi:hypothetical protein
MFRIQMSALYGIHSMHRTTEVAHATRVLVLVTDGIQSTAL